MSFAQGHTAYSGIQTRFQSVHPQLLSHSTFPEAVQEKPGSFGEFPRPRLSCGTREREDIWASGFLGLLLSLRVFLQETLNTFAPSKIKRFWSIRSVLPL